MKTKICIIFGFVIILLSGCLKKSTIKEEKDKATLDQVITFNIEDTLNLTADGKSKIKLLATIPHYKDASDAFKKITFETTTGIIDGTTTTKKEVTVDGDGNAVAYVTIGSTAGIFYLSATTGTSSAYRIEIPVYARKVADNTTFSITISDTTGIRADNNQLFKIKAQVANSMDKTVKFTINEGFIQGLGNQKDRIVNLDANGTAEILVKTDVNVNTYIVSAETNSTAVIQNSFFVRRAYADSILIEPSALKIDTVSQSINITTTLFRNYGKVSLQTPVYFESYQIDNSNNEKPVGRFTGLSNSFSNANGVVTVGFSADTGFLFADRPIKIRIKTKKDNGTFLVRIINLTIK